MEMTIIKKAYLTGMLGLTIAFGSLTSNSANAQTNVSKQKSQTVTKSNSLIGTRINELLNNKHTELFMFGICQQNNYRKGLSDSQYLLKIAKDAYALTLLQEFKGKINTNELSAAIKNEQGDNYKGTLFDALHNVTLKLFNASKEQSYIKMKRKLDEFQTNFINAGENKEGFLFKTIEDVPEGFSVTKPLEKSNLTKKQIRKILQSGTPTL